MQNIMKIVDSSNNGLTEYILRPENIIEIYDTSKGCEIYYASLKASAAIDGVSARQLKRSIQEKLDQPLGYLKTEYTAHDQHKGTRYFNVDHIAAVISHGTLDKDDKVIDVCSIVFEHGTAPVKIYHSVHDVALQIRRVMKRLDQDQEICCAPEAEQESE